MSLDLPTPDKFPAFPYDPPYGIQVDLMRHLYASIEQRKVTIVESPTGTVSPCAPAETRYSARSLGKNIESPLCWYVK